MISAGVALQTLTVRMTALVPIPLNLGTISTWWLSFNQHFNHFFICHRLTHSHMVVKFIIIIIIIKIDVEIFGKIQLKMIDV